MTVNVSQAVANVPNSTGTGAQRILRFKPSGDSRYYSVNSKSINVALLEEGMSFQKVVKEFYDVEDVATNLQQIPVAHTGAGMQQKGIVKKLLRQHSARTLLGRTKRQEKLVGGAQILIIEDAPKEDISKLVTWLYAKPRDGIKVLRSVETPQFMKLEPAEKRKAEPAVTERIDLKKDFGPAVERKNVASSFREKAVMTLASAAIGSLTGFGLSRLFPPSLPTPLATPLAAVVDTESTLVTSGISLAIDKIERGLPKDSPLRKELVRTLGDAFERSARIARASPTL